MALHTNDGNGRKKLSVSARKIEANRRNAQKSTGPKTLRGKAQSSRNAIKHGLFVKSHGHFLFENEDRKEFEQLYVQLRNELQPVGTLQNLEVENIAVCHWRLARIWRCENAEVRLGEIGVRTAIHNMKLDPYTNMLTWERALACRLDAARRMILEGRLVSSGRDMYSSLKEKVCGCDQMLAGDWPIVEVMAKKKAEDGRKEIAEQIAQNRAISVDEAHALLAKDPLAQPEYCRHLVLETISVVEYLILSRYQELFPHTQHAEYERCAIPGRDASERIQRARSSVERSLNSSLARYERLRHAPMWEASLDS